MCIFKRFSVNYGTRPYVCRKGCNKRFHQRTQRYKTQMTGLIQGNQTFLSFQLK